MSDREGAPITADRRRETGAPFGLSRRREPAARWLRAAPGWSLAALGLLAAAGCGQSPTAPTPPAQVELELITYTGLVFQAVVFQPDGRRLSGGGPIPAPIAGARVSIVGGQPHGRTAVTDAEGRFAFEDYPKCDFGSAECMSRRFRVEKAGYETRELGASDPYPESSFRTHRRPVYSASEKRIPMGHAWPDDPKIHRMRRDLPAERPLFLFENPYSWAAGTAGRNVITVRHMDGSPWMLHVIAHEYCHSHQAWVRAPLGEPSDSANWQYTPQGRAFVAAWNADRRATNDPFLDYIEIASLRYGIRSIVETHAEVCAHWFIENPPEWPGYITGPAGREYFRERLPHLHAWAEEWLRWRRWGSRP